MVKYAIFTTANDTYLCMSNELSLGTNLINSNDCLSFGQLLWPSSERKVTLHPEEGQSSWPKLRQSLLFIKLVLRESSFDMQKPTEKLPLHIYVH